MLTKGQSDSVMNYFNVIFGDVRTRISQPQMTLGELRARQVRVAEVVRSECARARWLPRRYTDDLLNAMGPRGW